MSVQGQFGRLLPGEALPVPDEIAFLLGHGADPAILAEAALIARDCGVTAEEALLRSGLVDERTFYRALADHAGLPFRDAALDIHPMARFPEAPLTGLVPLGSGLVPDRFAWAPRGQGIVRLLQSPTDLAGQFLITTPTAIREGVLAARGPAVAERAANGLARTAPDLSFRAGLSLGQALVLSCLAAGLGAAGVAWPDETALGLALLLGLAFLTGWSVERQQNPGFKFRPFVHEPGDKALLGKIFPEGEQGGIEAAAVPRRPPGHPPPSGLQAGPSLRRRHPAA